MFFLQIEYICRLNEYNVLQCLASLADGYFEFHVNARHLLQISLLLGSLFYFISSSRFVFLLISIIQSIKHLSNAYCTQKINNEMK